jgi:hypothetical protein
LLVALLRLPHHFLLVAHLRQIAVQAAQLVTLKTTMHSTMHLLAKHAWSAHTVLRLPQYLQMTKLLA